MSYFSGSVIGGISSSNSSPIALMRSAHFFRSSLVAEIQSALPRRISSAIRSSVRRVRSGSLSAISARYAQPTTFVRGDT